MESIFDHMDSCVVAMLTNLAFGREGFTEGTAYYNLVRAWYDVHGDNVRHTMEQLVVQAKKEALRAEDGGEG